MEGTAVETSVIQAETSVVQARWILLPLFSLSLAFLAMGAFLS
jgi:hypothetical protein